MVTNELSAAKLLTFLLLLTGCSVREDNVAPQPNVLFIAVDDLNDWVDVLGGHPGTFTPHINRLASQGTLFSNAYCVAPSCNPSRVAVLTGIRPSTSGVYSNVQAMRESPLLADAWTIPQYFRQHGYKVMGSGKIFHAGFPDPVSWDVYWPSHSVTKPMDPVLPVRTLDSRLMDSLGYGEKFGGWDWGPLGEADTAMGDWKVTDWVIGQLRKDHDKPFFLACGISKPHLKWHVPAKYFDLYPLQEVRLPLVKEDDLADIPPAGSAFVRSTEHQKVLESQQWHRAVQAYQASITFADVCVGRVLDALERSRYNRNTIVVLWSDHGFALGEKQHWRKFVLWEDVIKTVFVIHDTRDASKGHKVEDPVSLLDIYPTLVDLCGLTPKKELEGNDLSSLLKNPAIFWNKPVLTTHNRGNHSLRWRNWHYIRYADGSQELYDLNKDPHEWENLADEKAYAWVIRKLAKDLPRT